jgi:hypothetical protein
VDQKNATGDAAARRLLRDLLRRGLERDAAPAAAALIALMDERARADAEWRRERARAAGRARWRRAV